MYFDQDISLIQLAVAVTLAYFTDNKTILVITCTVLLIYKGMIFFFFKYPWNHASPLLKQDTDLLIMIS